MNYFLMVGVTFIFFGLIQLPSFKDEFIAFSPVALIAVSFPHFMLTYWLWHERVKAWKNEWWPILFPFLYVTVFILALKFPFGHFSTSTIIRLSYAYLMYHFAQQLFGITMWTKWNKGIRTTGIERWLWRGFFLVSGFYALIELELRGGTSVLFYYQLNPLPVYSPVVFVSFGLLSLLFVALLVLRFHGWYLKKKLDELFPLLFLAVGVIWFVPPFAYDMVFLLPVLHALQYFPFILMKKKKESASTLLVAGLIGMGTGWLFFRWLPFYSPGLMPENAWAPLVLTLLNNHHFIIDGRIWKLSDPMNKDLLVTARIDRY